MAGHEEEVPLMQKYSTPNSPIDARLSTYFGWGIFIAFLMLVILLVKSF